jgi:hypothetical protein
MIHTWQPSPCTIQCPQLHPRKRLAAHVKRTRETENRNTMLAMVFKLCQNAAKRWHRLQAAHYLTEVIQGMPFKDGLQVQQDAA